MDVSQEYYRRAKQLIPGGTQLLSKRPEMYAPGQWPPYFREARGCRVIDLDGREYCDMTTSGIGSCLLGYADPCISDAVIRRIQLGSMCTLNSAEEVQLAEQLISLHPWAEQARFCRTGGETLAIAVRIVRAATQRDIIAFCGYHGWCDWYLAANLSDLNSQLPKPDALAGHLLPGLSPKGVPTALAGTAFPFTYNNLDELESIAKYHGGSLAAVVMEPRRLTEPQPGFLEGVRQVCDRYGAALILDEVTSGWRFHLGGIHLRYDLEPDIVVFAKALGNGHPIGAVLGKRYVMDAAQNTFISSTYWTEAVGPTAALAAIEKMKKFNVPAHVEQIGLLFANGLRELGNQHLVPVNVSGPGALLHIGFDHPQSAALTTLFTIRMLSHGFLTSSSFYPSLAHEKQHVVSYLKAANEVFPELAEMIESGSIKEHLQGDSKHSGFARLT